MSQSLGASISNLLVRKPVIMQLLRFAAIGALNTAIDFIILNYVTKSMGIDQGSRLGLINVIGFTAATIQSYFWNRAWAFSQSSGATLFQNFYRLVLVGGLGFGAFLAVVLGAAYGAAPIFFLIVFIAFIISEIALWILFGLTSRGSGPHIGHEFAVFLAVSVVGLLINSLIIAIASKSLAPSLNELVNADTVKNIAKILATGVSLVWNFVGYKLLVFKR